jgi:hypothetical protein
VFVLFPNAGNCVFDLVVFDSYSSDGQKMNPKEGGGVGLQALSSATSLCANVYAYGFSTLEDDVLWHYDTLRAMKP